MSVLSSDDAKAHLNLSGTSTNLGNVELQAIIDAAESLIGNAVGPLTPEPITENLEATSSGALLLSTYPVVSLTSVMAYGGSAVDLSTADFRGGLVKFLSGSTLTPGIYTVVYQAGWSPLPADLLFAVKELVRHLVDSQRGAGRRAGAPPSDVANTVPGAAYALPIRVEQLIAPYRSPRVA